jgi:hypothetical protein
MHAVGGVVSESATITLVNRVDIGDSDASVASGTLRQTALHAWVEDSVKDGRDRFQFVETDRDDRSIYLFDASRKVMLQIDTIGNTVFYGDPTVRRREQFRIFSQSSKPTGWLATNVTVSDASKIVAHYVQIAPGQWQEQEESGKPVFSFTETERDDWSVYLLDASRNVRIQLDLYRNVVLLSQAGGTLQDWMKVAASTVKLNAWLANKVDVSADDIRKSGAFRQSGALTWAEDSVIDGTGIYEFHETQRDEWSIYLHDASRGVSLQLDLNLGIVYYEDPTSKKRPQFTILRSDVLPRLGIENAAIVNSVEYGDTAGKVIGHFRQTSESTWSEDQEARGRDVFTFREVTRDAWSVYLADDDRGIWVQIDLWKGQISWENPGEAPQYLYEVLNTSSKLNGWLVNTVQVENDGAFRQVGWTRWVEDSKEVGKAAFEFVEVGRDDNSVMIHDTGRDVHITIDLSAGMTRYSEGTGAARDLYKIESILHRPEAWRIAQRITSRSALTEDYDIVAGKGSVARPVYRCSVTLPPHASYVDIWGSEEVTFDLDGDKPTVDRVQSVRVFPSAIGKLNISIPATSLGCPHLLLRTDLMREAERYVLMPDVELHKKVTGLKDGAMWEARQQLGISAGFDEAHVADLQKTMKNVVSTVQYAYNWQPHGTSHDRAIYPPNMEDAHFSLDFSGGGARYSALTKADVLRMTAGARRIDGGAAQGFLDDLKDAFTDAVKVIVHTVEGEVNTVVDTVKKVATDVVDTVDAVGEHLVHGDLLDAAKSLVTGGENIGLALADGFADGAGTILAGAGQMLAITLELGGSLAAPLVQFIVDHTGAVGQVLAGLLEKAGSEVGKALGWLLDKVGWEDVIYVHHVIIDSINHHLDQAGGYVADLKAKGDALFKVAAKGLEDGIDKAFAALDLPTDANVNQPLSAQSEALEKLEWLLAKFIKHSSGVTPPFAMMATESGFSGGTVPMIPAVIGREFDNDQSPVKAAFEAALARFNSIFSRPDLAPQYLVGALLDVVKAIGLLGIDVLNEVFDSLMDTAVAAIAQLKSTINAEWDLPFLSAFYAGLTGGQKLSAISLVSLIIATPLTIIYKARYNVRPFNEPHASLALPNQGEPTHRLGTMYSMVHLMQTVTGVIEPLARKGNKNKAERLQLTDAERMEVNAKHDLSFALLNAVLGGLAQICANPVSFTQRYQAPRESQRTDVFQASDYWASVIWLYGMAGLGVSLIGFGLPTAVLARQKPNWSSKGMLNGEEFSFGLNDAYLIFNTLYGAVQFSLMCVLDYSDRRKRDALEIAFGTLSHPLILGRATKESWAP